MKVRLPKQTLRWCLFPLAVQLAGGCGSYFEPERDVVFDLGSDGEHYFFENFAKWDGMSYYPSSVWEVDADTGNSRRILKPRFRHGIQAFWDYCVFEKTEDTARGQKGILYGFHISSGDRFEIAERTKASSQPMQPASDPVHRLDRTKVATLADGSTLIIYDLAERGVVETAVVPSDAVEVLAFKGDLVLIGRGNNRMGIRSIELLALHDLATGEQFDVPQAPGSEQPRYRRKTVLSDQYVVTTRTEPADEHSVREELLAFDILDRTWRVLVQFEPYERSFPYHKSARVRGIDDTIVLVSYYGGVVEGSGSRIGLIDLETGERDMIAAESGDLAPFGVGTPFLYDKHVYWINEDGQMVVYDVASESRRVVPVDFPKSE